MSVKSIGSSNNAAANVNTGNDAAKATKQQGAVAGIAVNKSNAAGTRPLSLGKAGANRAAAGANGAAGTGAAAGANATAGAAALQQQLTSLISAIKGLISQIQSLLQSAQQQQQASNNNNATSATGQGGGAAAANCNPANKPATSPAATSPTTTTAAPAATSTPATSTPAATTTATAATGNTTTSSVNPTTPTVNAGSLRMTIGTSSDLSNLLNKTLNIPTNAIQPGTTASQLNGQGNTQNSTINFANNKGSLTLFNNNGSFPPSSTATLPKAVFDQQGVLSFYQNAQPLSPSQLQSVQQQYAAPNGLASRANYAANVANLAKNLTSIQQAGNLDPATNTQITNTINNLRNAYSTLNNTNSPAPDPRALYSGVAQTYASLSTNGTLSSQQQQQVSTGLNVLGISAANYDVNRVPVAGAAPAPAAAAPTAAQTAANQAAAARFPLPNFDTVRTQPLSAAQASPSQTFGSQVAQFLSSIGVNGVDVNNNVNFQVNSADQLQSIQVQLPNGRRLTANFAAGQINAQNAQFITQ